MPSKNVKVVEVGARDGLQNESRIFTLQERWSLVNKLSQSGLKNIEVGAFVSPKWVPQMQGSGKLVKKVLKAQKAGQLKRNISYSTLVPNEKGMELALESGIKEIAVFGAASESFSKRNINCTIDESFQRFENVIRQAKKNKIKVRGYLSTAFGCPYEGKVPLAKVKKLTKRLLDIGVYEVSIGDTIGVGTPTQVRKLLKMLDGYVPKSKIAMHFHDTRGTALANVLASLDEGIRIFDSSLGGLGGCPYAKGASGNLATEDLVYMLDGMGFKSGVNLQSLINTHGWVQKKIPHILPSHVGRAGRPSKPVI